MHGNEIFLPEQSDGYIRINNDIDIHNTTRICRKIRPQGQGAQWIHLQTGS